MSTTEERPVISDEEFDDDATVRLSDFNAPQCVRDGVCVDPPLCRGTSQGKYGSRAISLVCVGETAAKIREIDEMGARELVLVVSVRCGKE